MHAKTTKNPPNNLVKSAFETAFDKSAPPMQEIHPGTIIQSTPFLFNNLFLIWTIKDIIAIGIKLIKLTDCAVCCPTPIIIVNNGISSVPPPIPMPPSTPPTKPTNKNHNQFIISP